LHHRDGILVVSCYELGHQPIAAASVLGFLERARFTPRALDLAVTALGDDVVAPLRLVLISTPMHTALRVGVDAAARIRRRCPEAHICFFGHYAALNADYLLSELADSVVGGECEETLVELAEALFDDRPACDVAGLHLRERPASPPLKRLDFAPLSRGLLPSLKHYASLEADGTTRIAAAVESSRGCLHRCRHCPIPPVYESRFFVVPRSIVLDDIAALVESGARHITFADPDFFNGPGHAVAVVREMHERFPELTFDATIKVEHLLKHGRHLAELAACGCLFVVSAVESLSEEVLEQLAKGHTRDDVFSALAIVREAGIALRPSLVAFTPWTTLEDYLELLDWVARDNLIDHLEPVQFSIRLLVPPGSPLVELQAMRPHLGALEHDRLSYRWTHPDPRMDRLQHDVAALVQQAARTDEAATVTFEGIRAAARAAAGHRPESLPAIPVGAHVRPPRLTEPWFC